MFRFIIAALWTTFFLLLSIPVLLVELVIGIFAPIKRAHSSQKIICFAFKVLVKIAGTNLIIKGLDNIPKDTPCLLVPNHRSIFDIIITYPLYEMPVSFVAKRETKKIPVFSFWMALMNCQFLDRKDLRKGLKVILKCVDLVKKGSSICIFPEGTRNKGTDPLQPFHNGSLKISEKSGCPIVPVVINNSEMIFENQFPKIKKATVIVEYLPAITVSDLSKPKFKETIEKLPSLMEETYLKNLSLIK